MPYPVVLISVVMDIYSQAGSSVSLLMIPTGVWLERLAFALNVFTHSVCCDIVPYPVVLISVGIDI